MVGEGFGPYKSEALRLLETTVNSLNEFGVNHFLISGTLLGYIRHNDFIPWDDDIDLLVDESILSKLNDISRKNPSLNIFRKSTHKYDSIKFCFRDGLEIPENDTVKEWKQNSITDDRKYTWPFIDLFLYEEGPGIHWCSVDPYGKLPFKNGNPFLGQCKHPFRFFGPSEISFFHNEWIKSKFFPPKKINFLGVECNIPQNSNYFLSINYGENYMTNFEPPKINHKKEEFI